MPRIHNKILHKRLWLRSHTLSLYLCILSYKFWWFLIIIYHHAFVSIYARCITMMTKLRDRELCCKKKRILDDCRCAMKLSKIHSTHHFIIYSHVGWYKTCKDKMNRERERERFHTNRINIKNSLSLFSQKRRRFFYQLKLKHSCFNVIKLSWAELN
jgi:hypothetical protein